MIRAVLLTTAAFGLAAVAFSAGAASVSRRPAEDITHLLDRTITPAAGTVGTGTRRKSLDPGMVSITARVLCGEVARQGDQEARAVAGVILNRLVRARRRLADATLADVVLKNRRGVWAFTAADPKRANGELLWGRGVVGSRCHRRMVRIVNEEWERGVSHSFTHYWHPHAMVPRGAVPRWAKGLRATQIGAGMFVTTHGG